MKYRPTPLNILALLIIILTIKGSKYQLPDDWGTLIAKNFIPFAITSVLIDFLIQKTSAKYIKIIIIEIIIIAVIAQIYMITK